MVVLSAAVVGAISKKIARFTGYDLKFVREIEEKMRKNDLWIGTSVDTAEWFEPGGGVTFNLAVCVGLGWMEVAKT